MEPKKNEQKKTIPNRIALLRKQMGMSQKELADIVGVVQSTISVWENGQVAIDSNALPALSKALAVQVDYLLDYLMSVNPMSVMHWTPATFCPNHVWIAETPITNICTPSELMSKRKKKNT